MHPLRSFLTLAVLGVLSGCAGNADTKTEAPPTAPRPPEISTADGLLNLAPPASLCALDRSQPIDALALGVMQKYLDDAAQLLAVWRDCAALAASRAGAHDFDDPSIAIAVLTRNGRPVSMRLSRAAFLDQMGQALSLLSASTDLDAAAEKEDKKRFDESIGRLAKSVGLDIELTRQTSLGIRAHDENAIYLGMLSAVRFGKEHEFVAAVVAVTLLNDLVVQVNVAREFDGDMTLAPLVAEAQGLLRHLAAANAETAGERI